MIVKHIEFLVKIMRCRLSFRKNKQKNTLQYKLEGYYYLFSCNSIEKWVIIIIFTILF